jgi:hypothetical protein
MSMHDSSSAKTPAAFAIAALLGPSVMRVPLSQSAAAERAKRDERRQSRGNKYALCRCGSFRLAAHCCNGHPDAIASAAG